MTQRQWMGLVKVNQGEAVEKVFIMAANYSNALSMLESQYGKGTVMGLTVHQE